MPLDMIVPQHGRPFVGKEAIDTFLAWVGHLECGIDLLGLEGHLLPE